MIRVFISRSKSWVRVFTNRSKRWVTVLLEGVRVELGFYQQEKEFG